MCIFFAAALAAMPYVGAYARTLRHFNNALSISSARALSERLLADADAENIDARFVVALVATESSWRADATSHAGAIGLGQLMPATAAGLGVDPRDALANLGGTIAHVASLLHRYRSQPVPLRYEFVLAAYNAGTGAVERYGGVPPYAETRTYVRDVLALWRRLTNG